MFAVGLAGKMIVSDTDRETELMEDIESRVRKFYDSEGWVIDEEGKTGEDRHFRALSESRGTYDEEIRQKTVAYFDGLKGILLIAGSGDLPQSHMLAAEKFARVVCVDISWRALEIGKSKLGAKGDYHQASILTLPLPDESVDAVLCSHVLYHIDKKDQEKAVKELIRVLKPKGRMVILYRNPNSPLNLIQRFVRFLQVNKILKKDKLYVYSYPLSWWSQFEELCRVRILPCDIMSYNQARIFFPSEVLRRWLFSWAARFENQHSHLATKLWSYPRIILDKLDFPQ
jgi:SAM-dependent methyltransferase